MVANARKLQETKAPSRRRFLTVAAACAAVLPVRGASAEVRRQHVWRGVALGAQAEMRLMHADETVARETLHACVQEIRRLEGILSLYDPASTLVQLNRKGHVNGPDLELLELLTSARTFSQETGGAFDVTVQPIWQTYAAHFSAPDASPAGPPRDTLKSSLDLVGFEKIRILPGKIVLGQKGMALTLNGIAQGYVTDRIKSLLTRSGFKDVLIDLGEIYGGGFRPDGRAWQVGIASAGARAETWKHISLQNRAVATSSDAGHVLSPDGHITHLIDPRTAQTPRRYRSVSVIAENATTADALSTAFALMPPAQIERIVERRKDLSVIGLSNNGAGFEFG